MRHKATFNYADATLVIYKDRKTTILWLYKCDYTDTTQWHRRDM